MTDHTIPKVPPYVDLDDLAPEDLRLRAEALTAALSALRVQLLPLCDLADELLRDLYRRSMDAHERHAHEWDNVVLDSIPEWTGEQALIAQLHLINEATDYENLYRSWGRADDDHPTPLRAVED